MATGSSQSKRPGKRERVAQSAAEPVRWGGFVACTLFGEDRTACETFVQGATVDGGFEVLERLSLDGKVTFSATDNGTSFSASFTAKPNTRGFSDPRTLTAFAGDILSALYVLEFKDAYYLKENWAENAPNTTNKPAWG